MSRPLWDALRDYVVVKGGGSDASLDPASAPESAGAVSSEPDATPGAGAQNGQVGSSVGGARSFRVDAFVSAGGRTWLRRKWAIIGSGPDNPLPWYFSRVEAPRVLAVERSG
jgi:hypothetical protein